MLFTSLEFYFFLTGLLIVWRVAPARFGPGVLLAGSCLFCAWWQPWFVLVLVYVTLVSFLAGIRMASATDIEAPSSVLRASCTQKPEAYFCKKSRC